MVVGVFVGVCVGVAVNVVVEVGVFVGVCVGVAVKVLVVDGVGVGGIGGHPIKNCQAVPANGAVTTTKAVVGEADVLLKDVLPEPGPDTFGYPSAFN